MKPTPQVYLAQGHRDKYPAIDYCYHSAFERSATVATPKRDLNEARRLWRWSITSFRGEFRRDYVLEFTLFCLLIGLSGWPIIAALVAVARMIRNY